MRSGEVALAAEVSNRFLTPSKSKKKASLRAPAKNVMSPEVTMFGCRAEGHLDVGEDLVADGFGERDCSPVAMNTSTVCWPSTGVEKT